MEQWALDSINKHNALMRAAYLIVMEANIHCSSTNSEEFERFLENYEVTEDGAVLTEPGVPITDE